MTKTESPDLPCARNYWWMLSAQDRAAYERYAAWCQILKVPAADIKRWADMRNTLSDTTERV